MPLLVSYEKALQISREVEASWKEIRQGKDLDIDMSDLNLCGENPEPHGLPPLRDEQPAIPDSTSAARSRGLVPAVALLILLEALAGVGVYHIFEVMSR